jgi:hypothetical protein
VFRNTECAAIEEKELLKFISSKDGMSVRTPKKVNSTRVATSEKKTQWLSE